MMTSTPGWNAAASNSPWDSPVAPVAAPQISQSQTHGWNQNYNTAAVSAVSMHPPPPSVSSQYNQFNFGSNSYDSFRNQRTSLPSPNMNHQFLGTNGLSTSGKEIKICQKIKNHENTTDFHRLVVSHFYKKYYVEKFKTIRENILLMQLFGEKNC